MTDLNAPSTVPAVKTALLALFKSARGLSGVELDYGDPGIGKLQREHVFMGDTGPIRQSWAPAGRLQRDEQYELEVYVHVANPGWDQQRTTNRGYELAEVLAQLIRPKARTSTSIAAGVYEVQFFHGQLNEFVRDEGCAALLTNQVGIKARI